MAVERTVSVPSSVIVKNWLAKLRRAVAEIRDFLDEKAIKCTDRGQLPRLHRLAHFWLMVAKSYSRNRCPIRAAALAYTTLLALIPMLVVVVSVSSAILKEDGERRINQYIDGIITSLAPRQSASTNAPPAENPVVQA